MTITGSNLAGASAVKFNGLAATVGSDAATQITATVPNGASTGTISVTTPGGTATSASSFAVTFTLSAFAPASGPTGTDVTITGTGFTSTSSVKFNGVAATVLSRTPPSKLVAVVPTSASTGKITVTNTTAPIGTVRSASSYTVTPHSPPTISSFTPTGGITGSSVTINGTFFSGASAVKFGTLPAAYTIVSADQIKATVPNGAGTAKISVTTAVATATSTASYTPTLSITSFTPSSGPTGTDVTITGIGIHVHIVGEVQRSRGHRSQPNAAEQARGGRPDQREHRQDHRHEHDRAGRDGHQRHQLHQDLAPREIPPEIQPRCLLPSFVQSATRSLLPCASA